VIISIAYFGTTLWLCFYLVRLLYIAGAKGYVMALARPFSDTIETPQTRSENPRKFWANVIVAGGLLPLAVGGVWLSASDLYELLSLQTI
jgi:hypothetical protein